MLSFILRLFLILNFRFDDKLEVNEAQYYFESRHRTFDLNINKAHNPLTLNKLDSDDEEEKVENLHSGNELKVFSNNHYEYDDTEEMSIFWFQSKFDIEDLTMQRMDALTIKRKRHIQGENYSKGSSTYYDPDNSQCKNTINSSNIV